MQIDEIIQESVDVIAAMRRAVAHAMHNREQLVERKLQWLHDSLIAIAKGNLITPHVLIGPDELISTQLHEHDDMRARQNPT